MSKDYIIRGTAGNGQIRCFGITARDMVETARAFHNTSPVVTAALGRTLMAGAMMGSMQKGEKDVLTIQLRGDGPMQGLTVTAGSDSFVKGYALNPEVLIHAKANGKLDVSGAIGNGYLNVIKDMGLKEPYNGRVDLISGEIAEDLTYYFASSEQVPSSVGLGVLMNKDNTVKHAGGFIVQLMPFADDAIVTQLEANLQSVTSVTMMLDSGMEPEDILRTLLEPMDLEILDRIPTGYRCDCSKERVTGAIASLGKKDLQDMINDGETIEVKCQFCNSAYNFSVDELKDILKYGKRKG